MLPPYPIPHTHTKRFSDLSFSDLMPYDKIITEKNSEEERGRLSVWKEIDKKFPEKLILIDVLDQESISIIEHNGNEQRINLREKDKLCSLVESSNLLIDITGLPHHTWAPLLLAAYSQGIKPKVMYIEPDTYKPHKTPSTAFSFDLTESFRGVEPLPGFARLGGPENEDETLFIALLGFEGNRPQHLINNLDPVPKVIPIIGVPGFKIEMPQVTVTCNSQLLNENHAYSNIRYARASCPFEAFETLTQIYHEYRNYYLYIAPVGTKPHALGALWFAIQHPDNTEIMYDHPVRKAGRTKGIGQIHIYDLGELDAA